MSYANEATKKQTNVVSQFIYKIHNVHPDQQMMYETKDARNLMEANDGGRWNIIYNTYNGNFFTIKHLENLYKYISHN